MLKKALSKSAAAGLPPTKSPVNSVLFMKL